MKSKLLCAALAAASSAYFGATSARATLVYDFETNIPTLATGIEGIQHPTGPDGFYPNSASENNVTQATTGVTHGSYSMEVDSAAGQTYGGALSANIPAALPSATAVYYSLTTDLTAFLSTDYIDIVPVFFSTDGEIDPDTANVSGSFNNLGNVSINEATETLNFDAFKDPLSSSDGDTGDYTAAQVLAQDQALDPTDMLTGFQITIEHSGDEPLTMYFDNLNTGTPSVPEPASLTGLGVGALLLARRRRP